MWITLSLTLRPSWRRVRGNIIVIICSRLAYLGKVFDIVDVIGSTKCIACMSLARNVLLYSYGQVLPPWSILNVSNHVLFGCIELSLFCLDRRNLVFYIKQDRLDEVKDINIEGMKRVSMFMCSKHELYMSEILLWLLLCGDSM